MDRKQVTFPEHNKALPQCVCSLFMFVFMLPSRSFWLMPAFMLKKIVLGNFAKGPVDSKMADAIDFMVDRVSVIFHY